MEVRGLLVPIFCYRAKDTGGAVVLGELEAPNLWLARKEIAKSFPTILEVGPQTFEHTLKRALGSVGDFFRRPSLEDKLVFISQLETGFSVGIPVLQVLDLAAKELKNPVFRQAVSQVGQDVAQGQSLAQAFGRHPRIFDQVFVGMIQTGEITGELEKTLGRLGQITERQAENRAKVKAALFYPKVVLSFIGVVAFILIQVVIPKLKGFLSSMGQGLPPATRILLGLSDFLSWAWPLIALGAGGAYYSYRRYRASPAGALRIAQLTLRIPVLGKIILQLEVLNFCTMLDLLLSSGIPLLDALENVQVSQTNEVFKREIAEAREEIIRGGTLSRGLAPSREFPESAKGMMAIGEEAGRLPFVLQRLARYYQIQVDQRLNGLSKLIEPALLLVIFGMVLLIALAVFLPIWKMSSGVRH